jgi:hypothetical protein
MRRVSRPGSRILDGTPRAAHDQWWAPHKSPGLCDGHCRREIRNSRRRIAGVAEFPAGAAAGAGGAGGAGAAGAAVAPAGGGRWAGAGTGRSGRRGGRWVVRAGVLGPHTMHKLPIERQSPSRGICRTSHMHHMPPPAGASRNGRFCRTTAARGRAGGRLGRGVGAQGGRQADRAGTTTRLPGSGESAPPATASSFPGSGELAPRARRVRFPAPSSSLPGSGEFVSRARRVRSPAPASRFPDTASPLPRSRKDRRRNRGESGRRGLLIGVHCPGQPIVVAAQAQAAPRHIRGGPRAGSVRAERPCTGHHCRVLS